jgi:sulfoxide reductase heme-binding subunit YedZ
VNSSKLSKVAIFLACLIPLGWLIGLGFMPGPGGSALGPNPQEFVNRFLGEWALRIMLIALAVTPVRLIFRWNGMARFRRMLGLYAFFYAMLHLTSYIVLDQTFDWYEIWQDVIKRNFITVGMISIVLLIPLAVTSNNAMIKRMGGKRWRSLHKLVYVIAPLACLHFFMMRKGVQMEPLVYAAIATMLLLVRVGYWVKKRIA